MAGRFLCGARRNGELELLVTTAAGANGIVRDQWFAIVRLLRGPLLLVGIGALPQAASSVSMAGVGGGGELFGMLPGVCGMANAVLGVVAICWVGMWKGLAVNRPSGVVMWAVGMVEGIPLAALGLLAVIFGDGTVRFLQFRVGLWLWVVVIPLLILCKNVFFIWWAQRRLCKDLRAPQLYAYRSRRAQRVKEAILESRPEHPAIN